MLVAREIENKAFAKVCWKKNCIMGKLKVELTDLQLELWSSWGEWRSSCLKT